MLFYWMRLCGMALFYTLYAVYKHIPAKHRLTGHNFGPFNSTDPISIYVESFPLNVYHTHDVYL